MDLVAGDIVLLLGLALGCAAGVAVAVVLLRRAPAAVQGVAKSDRFGTAVIAGGAVFAAVVALANAVATITTALRPGAVTVYDLGRRVAEVPDDLMAIAQIEHASATAVDVTITDAPASVTAWLLSADLLPILLVLIVCAAAIWLAVGLLQGRPFSRRFPIALIVVASAVMVCGMFTQLAASIGRAEAASFLNAGAAAGQEPFLAFSIAVDLSPLGWGLVIGLLAGAFSIGRRMQRETEGLV